MKELKLRVWDNTLKRFYYSKDYANIGTFFSIVQIAIDEGNEVEYEMVLPFNDKNNNDIYEGDISKLETGLVVIYSLVKVGKMRYYDYYDNDHEVFSYVLSNKDGLCQFYECDFTLNIVGNLHENIELLNK